jgi:hypothetical protein
MRKIEPDNDQCSSSSSIDSEGKMFYEKSWQRNDAVSCPITHTHWSVSDRIFWPNEMKCVRWGESSVWSAAIENSKKSWTWRYDVTWRYDAFDVTWSDEEMAEFEWEKPPLRVIAIWKRFLSDLIIKLFNTMYVVKKCNFICFLCFLLCSSI